MSDRAQFAKGQALVEEGLDLMREAEEWSPGVAIAWVLLVPMAGHDEDGAMSGVGYLMSGGGVDWPLLLGTLRGATIKAEQQYGRSLTTDDEP